MVDVFATINGLDTMSDAFDARGDISPEPASSEISSDISVVEPNGFERLGLAPELVRAVADLVIERAGSPRNARRP